MGKPGVEHGGIHGEIAVGAKLPDHRARAGAVLVVDFIDTVLAAGGEQQVPVIGRIGDGVGVNPIVGDGGLEQRRTARAGIAAVLSQDRRPVDIQPVEVYPGPDDLPVFVQVHDQGAQDVHLPGRALDIGHEPFHRGQGHGVSIGQTGRLVVKRADGAPPRGPGAAG